MSAVDTDDIPSIGHPSVNRWTFHKYWSPAKASADLAFHTTIAPTCTSVNSGEHKVIPLNACLLCQPYLKKLQNRTGSSLTTSGWYPQCIFCMAVKQGPSNGYCMLDGFRLSMSAGVTITRTTFGRRNPARRLNYVSVTRNPF